jgi:amino acid transporter
VLKELFELLSQALRGEISTPVGQINLAFGVIVVGMVVALLTGHAIEHIGDFILRLLGRRPRPPEAHDTKFAIISVILFFVISLIIVAASLPRPPA